jgi:hypothetical protein
MARVMISFHVDNELIGRLQLVDVQVKLHWLEVGRGTSDSVLTATVAQCLRKVSFTHGLLYRNSVPHCWGTNAQVLVT